MPHRGTNARRDQRERLAAQRLEEKRRVWSVPLGGEHETKVMVEIDSSKTGCAHEMASEVTISVDDEIKYDVELYHSCSQWPACGPPNRHTWVEQGHELELALDGTALHVWKEAMVLFVDGRDIETGRSRWQYWRRVFLKKLLLSCLLMMVGSLGLILYFVTGHATVTMMLLLIPFGLVYFFMSSIGLCRFYGDAPHDHSQYGTLAPKDAERELLVPSTETV